MIRRRYVDGDGVPEGEIDAFTGSGGTLDAVFEESVHGADRLADRRFEKAEAAARLSEIVDRMAEHEALLKSLRDEEQALVEERAAKGAVWRRLWSEASIEPLSPDEMLEWLRIRMEAIGAEERRSKAERQVATLRHQESEARAAIVRALGDLDSGERELAAEPLVVVLERTGEVLARHERIAERLRELEKAHRLAVADEQRKGRALEKAQAAWSEWQRRWGDALAALAFSPTTEPDTVATRLDVLDALRERVGRIHEMRHERIGKIEGYIAAFAHDAEQLAGTVAPDLHGLDAEETVLQLERRLAESMRARDLRTRVDETIAELQRELDEHEEVRHRACAAVNRLQEEAGVADLDQLKGVIAKSDRLRTLQAQRAQVLEALREAGDGLSADTLNDECDGVDLDEARVRQASLVEGLDDLRERLLGARERRTEARKALEAVGGEGDDRAARAAADRQGALAQMREAAAQYVRVRTAAILLRWAIDRYRIAKQAPLLKSAGRLFSTLTGGSFASLRVNFDDHDRPNLVGVRPDNTEVAVPGMSTGTADQLYLALRIGAVADYRDRVSPLPFLADDLFINFDDARAAAGLEVLAQLATGTQVLFFTHHKHLVDIARTTLGEAVSVVELGISTSP